MESGLQEKAQAALWRDICCWLNETSPKEQTFPSDCRPGQHGAFGVRENLTRTHGQEGPRMETRER